VVGEDIAFGEVIESFANESRVVLYSSAEQITNVTIGPENISAEAEGIGGGNFKIFLPRDVPVEIGELIVVPALHSDILGVVGMVRSSPSDALKEILFKTPLNVQELKWVYVILD
jgi:hypothetical protein